MLRLFATFLLFIFATPTFAQSAAELCDQYAGHPWEPGHVGRGVEWGEVLPGPAIRACREALEANPDSPAIMYRLGRTLMQIRSYEEGLALVLRSAAAGYPPAETAYGTAYMQADGVDINYKVAVDWLEKAAAHGNAIGLNNLALLTEKGAGTAPDLTAARELYRKAAEAGYSPALYNLALSYEWPPTGESDHAASFAWHTKAATAGYVPAYRALGRAYQYGKGVAIDLQTSLQWYLKGAVAGDPVAEMDVGVAYGYGRGVAQNLSEGEKWLRASAEHGYPRGQMTLGQFLMRNKRGDEFFEGVRWLERAGAYGELQAYIELGHYYAQTGDLRPARKNAEVVLNFGSGDLKRQAQELLMIIDRLELQTDIRRFDAQPFKSSDEG
jgi:uncharacterized protein